MSVICNDYRSCDGTGCGGSSTSAVSHLFFRPGCHCSRSTAFDDYLWNLLSVRNHGCIGGFFAWYGLWSDADDSQYDWSLWFSYCMDYDDFPCGPHLDKSVYVLSDFVDIDSNCTFHLFYHRTKET